MVATLICKRVSCSLGGHHSRNRKASTDLLRVILVCVPGIGDRSRLVPHEALCMVGVSHSAQMNRLRCTASIVKSRKPQPMLEPCECNHDTSCIIEHCRHLHPRSLVHSRQLSARDAQSSHHVDPIPRYEGRSTLEGHRILILTTPSSSP